MAENRINRDLFRTYDLDPIELTRRCSELAEQLHEVFQDIISELDTLSDRVDTITSTGNYTGIIYAMDKDNNTVELRCKNGKVDTVAQT